MAGGKRYQLGKEESGEYCDGVGGFIAVVRLGKQEGTEERVIRPLDEKVKMVNGK